MSHNMIDFDTSQTLDQLEGVEWGPPDFESHLVQTCHRLRTKPVGQFSAEELRIMIGQNIGLDYLVPLALEHLEDHLLAGDLYEGALLHVVATADPQWWNAHRDTWYRLDMLHHRAEAFCQLIQEKIGPAVNSLRKRLFGIVSGAQGAEGDTEDCEP